MDQIKYNRDVPQIINVNEPHMALLFLLDVSGSMSGEPIDELNKGLNRFKKQVCQDEQTKKILDVAIIAFNDTHRVVQDFAPVEKMKTVNLDADGSTYMQSGLETAIKMIDERSRTYRRLGTEPYKPWIVLISDGHPFDNVELLAKKINKMVENNKLAFWSLAVEGADLDVLHQLSGKRVLELKDYDFTSFFNWVNKSMRAVSISAPGEKPALENTPDNVVLHIIPDELK